MLVFFWLAATSWPPSSTAEPHDLTYQGYDGAIRSAVATYWGAFDDWRWWKAQIFAESAFDTDARSGVGAEGLCQAMPGTFGDWAKALRWTDANPHIAHYCIDGGAFYMGQLRAASDWRGWTDPDRQRMAQASYNAGRAWINRARVACKAGTWTAAAICLPQLTGKANARQTTDYVERIARFYTQLLGLPAIIAVPCRWSDHRGGCSHL